MRTPPLPRPGHRCLVALAVLLFVAGCLFAPRGAVAAVLDPRAVGDASWLEVRTAHFRILSDADESTVTPIGRRLEQFCELLHVLHPELRTHPALPVQIYVFRDTARTHLFTPASLENRVAFATVGPGRNVFVIDAAVEGTSQSALVCHEYTHLFLHANFAGIPIWLNEGLAQYYETFRPRGRVMEFGHPQHGLEAWLDHHDWVDLGLLFAVNSASNAYRLDNELSNTTYAEGWALTHYLMAAPDRAARLDSTLAALRRGTPARAAFRAQFPESDWPKLVASVKQYVHDGMFDIRSVRLAEELQDVPVTTRPAPAGEVFTLLGDLVLSLGADRLPDADALYREALDRDSTLAQARAGAGFVADLRADPSRAQGCYARAGADAPADARVALLAGLGTFERLAQLYRAQSGSAPDRDAAAELARHWFQRCVKLDPGNVEAEGALARLDMVQGRITAATCSSLASVVEQLPERSDFVKSLKAAREALAQAGGNESAGASGAAPEAPAPVAPAAPVPADDRPVAVTGTEPSESRGPGLPDSTLGSFGGTDDELRQAARAADTGKFEEAIVILLRMRSRVGTAEGKASLDTLIGRTRIALGLDHAYALARAGSFGTALDTVAAVQRLAFNEESRGTIERFRVETRARQHVQRANQLMRAGNLKLARVELVTALQLPASPETHTYIQGLVTQLDKVSRGR